ncbi:MAG: ABC transporter permease [Bryobacteraceae bacterium]
MRDFRYALRTLAARPGFTAVALLTLAISIGANTAVFTVVNAILLRPMPFRDPAALVTLANTYPRGETGFGLDNYRDVLRHNTVFEGMALTQYASALLRTEGQEDLERILGTQVTPSFFTVLGVAPALGRAFLPEEDLPGQSKVAVISHGLWLRAFGGSPDAIGRALPIVGDSYTVVGVMPAGFWWASPARADFWIPFGYPKEARFGRMQHQYTVIARLKAGAGVKAAQAQMDALARRLEEYPENHGYGIRVRSFSAELTGQVGAPLATLGAVVALVLLIGCANVVSLMLARASGRSREIAVRCALGASRGRILRQVLSESVVISLGGGGLGALFALWLVDLLAGSIPAQYELPMKIAVDGRVLAFTLLLSVITALLFGIAPAVRAARADPARDLRASGAAGISRGHQRFLRWVMVGETAIAAVLLITAGLALRSFLALVRADLGFRATGLTTMHVRLPRQYSRLQSAGFFRELLERISALPGIEAAGATDSLPLAGGYSGGPFYIEGRPAPRQWNEMSTQYCTATPGYFRAMGMRVLRGRDFTSEDRAGGAETVIVNDTLARQHWPGENPVGRRIRMMNGGFRVIVGVVAGVRYGDLAAGARPASYIPADQSPSPGMSLALRTATPEPVLAAVRAELRRMEPEVIITRVQSMEQAVGKALAPSRLIAALLGGFAGTALLLAGIGLYGVIAYSVARRTHELGLRMALGARQGEVLAMVVRTGLWLACGGLVIGLPLAGAAARVLAAHWYGVAPLDPVVFTAAPLMLAAVAALAGYIPARRAASVDPVEALRFE